MKTTNTNVSAASVLAFKEASPVEHVRIAYPASYLKLSAADDAVSKAAARIKEISSKNLERVSGFEAMMARFGDLTAIELDAIAETGTDFQASVVATVFKRVRDMSYRDTPIKLTAHEAIKDIAVSTADRVHLLFAKQTQLAL
jgi:hypothetical protein